MPTDFNSEPEINKPSIGKSPQNIKTVGFVSLGCPKNLVDSEKMLGLLAEDGLLPVSEIEQADAIVVNTCGFLEAAKEESISVIAEAAKLKEAGSCKRIIVAGCLVQRHRAKLLEWCPEIDALIGVFDRDHIVQAVRNCTVAGNDVAGDVPAYSSIAANATIAKKARDIEAAGYYESDAARLRLTPRHYAYLRISEGCNQNCTFCTIPGIRGKMRSKSVEAICSEARELIADGAYELNLIGQDTTSFGQDINYDAGLVGMLTALNDTVAENGGGWLRLMYAYPSRFSDAMIDAIASLSQVVKYIDIPLQHINDQVLDNMKRNTSRVLIETLLEKLRTRIPGMAIRTTFISGYPGETDEQHEELLNFIKDYEFDALGVFAYSPEPGTPAATAYDAGGGIDAAIVDQRVEQLMLAQQEIAFKRNEQFASSKMATDILIDEQVDEPPFADLASGHKVYVGRSSRQAPEVDSVTYVTTEKSLASGELVQCRITGYCDYDLIARPASEIDKVHSLPVIN